MLRRWFDDQDFIACSIFFSMFEKSWKYGSISEKYNMIVFLIWRVLQKNGVDGQLLHAFKTFCGADWSFAVE